CPLCGQQITVGTAGSKNMDMHKGSKRCKQQQKQREKEAKEEDERAKKKTKKKPMKQRTLFEVANPPHPLPGPSPSTPLPQPAPEHSNPPSQPAVARAAPSPLANKLLSTLRDGIAHMPSSIPVACENDELVVFENWADNYRDMDADIVWEDADQQMNNVFGGGRPEEEIRTLVRRGDAGMDGVLNFFEFILIDKEIDPCLLSCSSGRVGIIDPSLVDKLVADGLATSPAKPAPNSHPLAAVPAASTTGASLSTSTRPPSPRLIVIDDSDDGRDGVHGHGSAGKTLTSTRDGRCSFACNGFELPVPGGQWGVMVYPFALHTRMVLPWSVHTEGRRIWLTASKCTGRTKVAAACAPCSELGNNGQLVSIVKRMKDGVHENTPHIYQPISGLHSIIRTKTFQVQALRLGRVNLSKSLARKSSALDDHKRFLLAIADSDFSRVQDLIQVCIKNGMSVQKMAEQLDKATRGLYSPKSFSTAEKKLCVLILRLAGPRVLSIYHKATGAPATSTIQRCSVNPPLRVSAGFPSIDEVSYNVKNSFAEGTLGLTDDSASSADQVYGYSLMIDEIKVEGRPRWDDLTNKIVGVAREDADKIGLDFCSEAEAYALVKAVADGKVRLAVEATVAAIGLLAGDSRSHAARPILVSGTCKTEDAPTHADLIQVVIDACEHEKVPGRLYCIASDGEARRGAALVLLTHKRKLAPSSPIFSYVGKLPLMNTLVGDNDLTSDKDWKHVIMKRIRCAILRDKGITIYDYNIPPATLGWHLRSGGLAPHQVENLMNPNDKQDVLLAVSLLKSVWDLPETSSTRPTVIAARKYIRIFGNFLRHLITPYIDVNMSLSDQLAHLSAAAHLACSLYTHPGASGGAFLPKPLYTDIQILIKNVFFCVAKAKVDRPLGNFYIIMLGTDRLEISFGIYRTIVGNDANADLIQLGDRIAHVTESGQILVEYPEWDTTPRRLKLPGLSSDEELTAKVDHINPASWRGDVSLKHVLPITAWTHGRETIEHDYAQFAVHACFARIQESGGDLLFPDGSPPGPCLADPDPEDTVEDDPIPIAAPTPETDDLDMEDRVAIELAEQNQTFSPYVQVEGKRVYKARVLRQLFRFINSAGSTDRLKRVAGLLRFTAAPDIDTDVVNSLSIFGGAKLFVGEPLVTLVKANSRLFLAVVQISAIHFHSSPVVEIAAGALGEEGVSVTTQILILTERSLANPGPESEDWEWSGKMGRVLKSSPGHNFQAINPNLDPSYPTSPSFLFSTADLQAFALSLQAQITQSATGLFRLPSVPTQDLFPYRSGGASYFLFSFSLVFISCARSSSVRHRH
ncbi:hypothetical protein CONPUDRAFT_66200, partial [Coniophora puteana RWD-64-598 SS2]